MGPPLMAELARISGLPVFCVVMEYQRLVI